MARILIKNNQEARNHRTVRETRRDGPRCDAQQAPLQGGTARMNARYICEMVEYLTSLKLWKTSIAELIDIRTLIDLTRILQPLDFVSPRKFKSKGRNSKRRKIYRFLRDFGYDAQLLKDDQVDEKALCNLRGVVRTSYTTLNGRAYQNLDAFAPEADWELLDCTSLAHTDGRGGSDGL